MLKLLNWREKIRTAGILIWMSIMSQIVLANTWQDLWLNKNQQGQALLRQNKNSIAAQTFTDKNWKGIAYYRDGKYQQAYDEFKQDNSAQGLYNQGNALAHMKKYAEAISAYNKSLALIKNSPDAIYNKELVEKLLQQQQQQQQQQQNQSNKDKSDEDKKSPQNNQKPANPDKSQQSDKSQANNQQPPTNNSNTQQPVNNSRQLQNAQNKQQQDVQNTQQQQDTANNQQRANYMRPQTPVDEEVKSALSQIPDDPGGLLRNKFLRDYQKQTQDGNNE